VFGWTQIRLNLPAWLGVGTALATIAEEPGGIKLLQEMAENWNFFDDLLGKIEMICAKSDLDIARLYIETLTPERMHLWEELEAEFVRTVETIRKIRRSEYLLADQPHLQTAIIHRDRYLDPLSLMQVGLLALKKEKVTAAKGPPPAEDRTTAKSQSPPEIETINQILGTTLNGIAQGLRNTG
jgi:phosphoenolpyruvate carboxylase